MGRRLYIVIVLLLALAVEGKELAPGRGMGAPGSGMGQGATGREVNDFGSGWAMESGQKLVQLASNGDMRTNAATDYTQSGVIVALEGDPYPAARLGAGLLPRRMLGEKAAKAASVNHDPDLAASTALLEGQIAVGGAAGGNIPTGLAAFAGHETAVHGVVGTKLDLFRMRAGLPLRKRLLGETAAKAAKARPEFLSGYGMSTAQEGVARAAAGEVPANTATAVGLETGLMGAIDPKLDGLVHLGNNEMPQGLPPEPAHLAVEPQKAPAPATAGVVALERPPWEGWPMGYGT